MEITLNYYIIGETPVDENIFQLRINNDETIAECKSRIHTNEKVDTAASLFKLWHLPRPIATDGTDGRVTILKKYVSNPDIDIEGQIGGKPMKSLDKLFTYFPTNLSNDRIHLLVELITKRKITCNVKYGRKTGHFEWIVFNEAETTLDNLIHRIRPVVSIPDAIRDRDLTIMTKDGNTLLDKDIVLQAIVWNNYFFNVGLNLTITTPQKSFALWHFKDVKQLFNIRGESWETLPSYKGSTMDISMYNKKIDTIIDSLLMVQQTSPNVATANEAARREYISPILHGVASCFGNSIKIYPEHEITGNYGNGPVDWAIKTNDKYILITEAKRDDVDHGVGQNIMQLHSAFQKNKNNQDTPDVLYGIVTTAMLWVILKVVLKENDNDQPIKVSKSSLTPVALPLHFQPLNKSQLSPPVEQLFGQLLWVFNEQLNS